jgi:hypothetical protein
MFYWPPRRPRDVAHIPRRTLLKEMDYIGMACLRSLHVTVADFVPRLLPIQWWTHNAPGRLVPRRKYSPLENADGYLSHCHWSNHVHWMFRLGLHGVCEKTPVPCLHVQEIPRVHCPPNVSHRHASNKLLH